MIGNITYDELDNKIKNGVPNYQRFIIAITSNIGKDINCNYMIAAIGNGKIDAVSNEVIQHCIQQYKAEYKAYYIDKSTKLIELYVNKEVDPNTFIKHSYWTEKKTGEEIFDYCFICNECYKETPNKAFIISPDYCPFCGAKMDLKGQNK